MTLAQLDLACAYVTAYDEEERWHYWHMILRMLMVVEHAERYVF